MTNPANVQVQDQVWTRAGKQKTRQIEDQVDIWTWNEFFPCQHQVWWRVGQVVDKHLEGRLGK